ncbi:MAG: class I SAM-dependent methyltransferase [Candidatus Aenigmatarchaeota archaeon]
MRKAMCMMNNNFKEASKLHSTPWNIEDLTRYMHFLNNIKKIKGKKILELGSGSGSLTEIMSKNNKVFGVDIEPSEKAIKHSKFIIWDLNKKIKYKDNSFDIIFAMEVLEHLNQPEVAMKEAHRLLKNNGLMYIDVPTTTFNVVNEILYWIDKPIDKLRQSSIKGDRTNLTKDLKAEFLKGMPYYKRFAMLVWNRLNDGSVMKGNHPQKHTNIWWEKRFREAGFKIVKKYNSGAFFPFASFMPRFLHKRLAESELPILPAFVHYEVKK